MSPNSQRVGHDGTVQHVIPPTAVEVCIHNVLNPYAIRVSDVEECSKMLKFINEKLSKIVREAHNFEETANGANETLKPNTKVVVHRKTANGVDLPAWYSRGIIISHNNKTSNYLVFLPDYAEYFDLSRDSFITISRETIDKPYVTYTICMDAILPVKKAKLCNRKQLGTYVDKDWSPQAIDLTKELIRNSRKAYFHHTTTHKNGIMCGELYLIIDDQIVPLREALIRALCATTCIDELFSDQRETESSTISSPNNNESSDDLLTLDDPLNSVIVKAKRNVSHEILVHSNVECKRLNNITEAQFDKRVLEELNKLSITHLRRLQSYIWPAINKRLDVLAIGPQKCGKTMGYAVPIASLIVDSQQYQVDYHPMVLVLCSSSSQVLYIESIFKSLLSPFKEIRIISAFNGRTDRSLMAGIINGCHIFISTPAFLVRFFERDEHHRKYLKLDHISHLVIDDLDILLDKHSTALTQLLGRYTLVGKKNVQHTNMLALQLVAAAQQWSPTVGKFTEIFMNPYICISSFAEAAIFCGVLLRPHLVMRDQKKIKVAELLCEYYRKVKTMIVCANTDEADELSEFLADKFKIIHVHKKMLYPEILDIKRSWDASVEGTYQVMICVDDVLSMLNITDVSWLIHYSVDVPSKHSFLFRFSTLMTNLKKESRKIEVSILIDDTNNLQFRGIMDMVKRSGITIAPKLLRAIEKVTVTLERDKKNYLVCNNIKSFGYCPKSGRCNYRHCLLPEVDAPMTPLAAGNRFKFTITYVHNATHFSGRIISYVDDNNEKHELSDIEHIRITSKVQNYYSNKINRRRSREIVVGGAYGYDDSFDTHQRVQVLDIVSRNNENEPLYVDVKCIDSGILLDRIRTSKLLELPKELADAPAHIFEFFLADLMPYDDEREWNVHANECTHKWFSDQLKERDAFLQGRVCLHLGNTIWMNPLEARMKMIGNRELMTGSLTSHLIKEKYGIVNREHMISLKKLCVNAGIDVDELDN